MNDFKVWINWDGDWVPLHDYGGANLIREQSFTKTQILHNNLEPVRDKANFLVDWRTPLANDIFDSGLFIEDGGDGQPDRRIITIDIREVIDGTEYGWFYGYVRPITTFFIGEDKVIEFECLDNSWRLFRKPVGDLLGDLNNKTVAQIVDTILEEAGYTSFEREMVVSDLGDEGDIGIDTFPGRPNDELQDIVKDLLYAYGHVYYFDELGRFRAYRWIEDDITADGYFNDNTVIEDITADIDESRAGFDLDPNAEWDKITIRVFNPGQTASNVTIGSLDANDKRITASESFTIPFQYYVGTDYRGDEIESINPQNFRIDFDRVEDSDGFWSWLTGGTERVSYSASYSSTGDSSRGLEMTSFSFDNTEATITLQNNNPYSVYIDRIRVRGGVEYTGQDAPVQGALPGNAAEVQDKYINDREVAKRLFSALRDRYELSIYSYRGRSEEDFSVGQYVNVQSLDLNIVTIGRVIQRTEDFDNGYRLYTYEIEQVKELDSLYTVIDGPILGKPTPRDEIEDATSKANKGLNDDGTVSQTIAGNSMFFALDDYGNEIPTRPSGSGLYMSRYSMGFYDENAVFWPVRIYNDEGIGKMFVGSSNRFMEWDGQQLNIQGNAQSENFVEGSAGWRITVDGNAEFNELIVRGTVEATDGYIGGWTIDDGNLLAENTELRSDGSIIAGANFSVDSQGHIVATSAEFDESIITGSSFTTDNFSVDSDGVITATAGTIGGWLLGTDYIKSVDDPRRIELNKPQNRISVFDENQSKVVMGFLNDLPKRDGTGNWGPGDYGFWAREGDRLTIDGDVEYENGDWSIENDASLIIDTEDRVFLRLGSYEGIQGLYLNEEGEGDEFRAELTGSTFFVGNDDSHIDFRQDELRIELDSFAVGSMQTNVRGHLNISTSGDILTGLNNPLTLHADGQGKGFIGIDEVDDIITLDKEGNVNIGNGLIVVRGPLGPKGPTGPEGPKGDKPSHEWNNTELRFENPDGNWGDYTDLKGEPGIAAQWDANETPYPADAVVTHEAKLWKTSVQTSEEPGTGDDWAQMDASTLDPAPLFRRGQKHVTVNQTIPDDGTNYMSIGPLEIDENVEVTVEGDWVIV